MATVALLLFVGGAAAWTHTWLSITIGALVILGLAVAHRRARRLSEQEKMRRLDEAMGKPSDDLRYLGRYVP